MLTSRRLYNFYNTQSNDGLPRPQIFSLNQHNPADRLAVSPLKSSAGDKERMHTQLTQSQNLQIERASSNLHHHHRLQRRFSILLYFNISVYLIKHIYI